MKQLTCEMCGGTDLTKQDGVFVCQTCGCKYSVEEARKMMVEGTVDVRGTISVDKSNEFNNYLSLAESAINSNDGKTALDYANKALEIEPKNARAWIAKMKSYESIATYGDSKTDEIIEAGKQAILCANEDEKSDITYQVSFYRATRSLDLLKLAKVEMLDVEEVKKDIKDYRKIDFWKAESHVADLDKVHTSLYIKIQQEATRMLTVVGIDAMASHSNILYTVEKVLAEYNAFQKAYEARVKLYGLSFTDAYKAAIANFESVWQKSIDMAKNKMLKRKEEAISRYWEEHKEEKEKLDNEKAELTAKVAELEKSIDNLPELVAAKQIEQDIKDMEKEKSSLGLFKGKEKKALQGKIDVKTKELADAKKLADSASEPLKKQIADCNKRIKEIVAELTKER